MHRTTSVTTKRQVCYLKHSQNLNEIHHPSRSLNACSSILGEWCGVSHHHWGRVCSTSSSRVHGSMRCASQFNSNMRIAAVMLKSVHRLGAGSAGQHGPHASTAVVTLSNGYLAFTSSFSDEEPLLPEESQERLQGWWQQVAGSRSCSRLDGLGFAAIPSLFAAGCTLQHALSWKHASFTATACPLQV